MPVKALFYIIHTASNKRFFVFFHKRTSQRPNKAVPGHAEKHNHSLLRLCHIRLIRKKKRLKSRLKRTVSGGHALLLILFPHCLCKSLRQFYGHLFIPGKRNNIHPKIPLFHPETTTSRIKEDKANGYGSLVEITTRPPVSKPGLGIVTSLSPE